jgi:uncharacterized tellurite resistance protein B-like protein
MSFTDLFESGTHRRNLGHFASLVNIAAVDGRPNENEERLLKRFARKLDVTDAEYNEVLKNPSKYPFQAVNSADERLERMLEFFKLIYIDHGIDEEEQELIERYAIGLGYPHDKAMKLIDRSIQIFNGGLDIDDYRYLLNRK